jgi:hypothetical protein
MFGHNNTEITKNGNSPILGVNFPTIEALVRELAHVDAEHARLHANTVDDAAIEPVYDRHWALRGLINATPARSLRELRAKERAQQIAAELDEDFACHGPGSARELAKALVADAIALMSRGEAA